MYLLIYTSSFYNHSLHPASYLHVSLPIFGCVSGPAPPQFFISPGRQQALQQRGPWSDRSAFPPPRPPGVDSCQCAGLCPRLQCGRSLLAVMYSHHPSPGGLPPLISMPRPVTGCSSDCGCASSPGFRWPRSFVLSIDSPLEGCNRNTPPQPEVLSALSSSIPGPTKGGGLDGSGRCVCVSCCEFEAAFYDQ